MFGSSISRRAEDRAFNAVVIMLAVPPIERLQSQSHKARRRTRPTLLRAFTTEQAAGGSVRNAGALLLHCRAWPNPSLERTSTGLALGPRGFPVYPPPHGPSAKPLAAAQLKR